MSIAFLVTSLIVVATPGTGVIYTLSAALSRGRGAGVIAALGCTLGIVPHILATITGLAALLRTSSLAFQILKYLGVAYLLFMAWATLKDKDAVVLDEDSARRSAGRVIVSAVLINLLNPKLTVFFFAFLPQFVSVGEAGSLPQMIGLSAVFMLMTFVVFSAYGLCAAAVRDHATSRPQVMAWLRRGFAGSFIALGAKLAFAAR
ncbi:MAG TPA: LysE family translocator [Streptosporangiaceae bacterium]|jgi:threonine/homoserine/homoserine lactone efflux protein|nr:LysE family translocator [Streptosporangiaceae bacterium]